MAFSKSTRVKMYERAVWHLGQQASEMTGMSGEPLSCCHIIHSRSYRFYDHPSNGFVAQLSEHLIDHILREGSNGLCKKANDWAIDRLTNQIVDTLGDEYLDAVYSYVSLTDSRFQWDAQINMLQRLWYGERKIWLPLRISVAYS